MATRGKLYRCHLFSYAGPQTPGMEAIWTKELEPIGDRTIQNGDIVELLVTLSEGDMVIGVDTPIRFDILEEDFILTGGSDDFVVSILGSASRPGDASFPTIQRRITCPATLRPADTLERAVSRFAEEHPTDYTDYLLVITDSIQSNVTYLVTWWRAEYVDDVVGKAEYYFIVNVDDQFESQSTAVMNVEQARGTETTRSGFQDDGEVARVQALPPLGRPATDEPSFREAAEQIVRASKAFAELDVTEAPEPVPPSIPMLDVSTGAVPAAASVSSKSDGDDFGAVIIIDLKDPYGTGWAFAHNDDPEHAERDHFDPGPTRFDGLTLYILRDSSWTTITVAPAPASGHYVAFDLTRAVRWGKTQFGTRAFAVLEYPLIVYGRGLPLKADGEIDHERAPHYLVVPLAAPVAFSQMRKITYRDADGNVAKEQVPVRYQNFFPSTEPGASSPEGKEYCALRAVGTTDDTLVFYDDPDHPIKRELFRQLNEGGFFKEIDPAFRTRLRDAAFKPLDAALSAHDDEKALAFLLERDFNAYALVTADERFTFLEFLLLHVPIIGEEKFDAAVFQIFKAIEGGTELIRLRDKLGPAAIARLIRNHANIWGLLVMLGKKLEKELPLESPLEFLATLLQLSTIGTASKKPGTLIAGAASRLILGPAGFAFSPDVLSEVRQAAVSFVQFAHGTIKGLYDLITKPEQIVDAIGQLMQLVMTVEIARLPVPPPTPGEPEWMMRARKEHDKAVKKLTDMFDGALKSVRAGYHAATVLSEKVDVGTTSEKVDVRDQLLIRIKWTILWEVLALFVGVGEVKAAVNFARAGIEAASIAALASKLKFGERGAEFCRLFAKALSRESRLIAAEEEAARALSRLPKEDVQALEAALDKAKAGDAQTLEQLMAQDPEAAKAILKGRQQTEAMAVLIQKSRGAASEEAGKAFARLSKAGVKEPELLAMMEGLLEGEGTQFVAAVNALSEEALTGASAYADAEFLKKLAVKPDWARAIVNDEKAFGSIYRHAGGDTRRVSTMVDAMEDLGRELKGNADAVKAAMNEIENADPNALQKLAKGPQPPVEVRAPEIKPPEVKPAVEPHVQPQPSTGSAEPPHGPVASKLPPDPPEGVNAQVYDMFNRDVATVGDVEPPLKFYQNLDQTLRDSANWMAEHEHGMFRSIVTELTDEAFEARKAKFLKQMAREGREAQIAKIDETLTKLRTEFKGRALKNIEGMTTDVIKGRMTSPAKYRQAAEGRAREIEQRLNEYRRKATTPGLSADESTRAADRAKALERELNELRAWMDEPARAQELEELVDLIDKSPFLKDRLAHGGDSMLYRLYTDMKFRPKGRKPVKSPFEKYVGRRMGEFRGLGGEMDTAFQIGGEFDLLKAPDQFVTRRGIDLIAQRRIDGMIAILDNKSIFGKFVKDVSALTRRLVINLREDALEFRRLAKRFADAEVDFVDAANRMDRVAAGMERELLGVPQGEALSAQQQRAIAEVLKKNNMQFLVTNVGGQATGIVPELAEHIQFWDLQQIKSGLKVKTGPLPVGPMTPAPPPIPVTPVP